MPAPRALLLDGGMAYQLKRMGVGLRTKRPFELTGSTARRGSMERILGVALANTRTPRLVQEAHLSYIDAGAEIITTNNYAVVPATLRTCEDVSEDGDFTVETIIPQVLRAAGRAARAAVDARPERNVRVAGCLPPLSDSYEPEKVQSFEQNLMEYRLIVDAIAPYSDLLICETLSTAQEARAAVQAGSEANLPVWCSWTLDEAQPLLRSGETLGDALEALGPELRGSVDAFLFNCTSTESMTIALKQLLAEPLLPKDVMVGGYANAWRTSDMTGSGSEPPQPIGPEEYCQNVTEWLALQEEAEAGGAEERTLVVGGCCGIFPEHIAKMREAIDNAATAAPC
jgi:S-methylmethionine-dependent homocysteine/selenocysteine methylase